MFVKSAELDRMTGWPSRQRNHLRRLIKSGATIAYVVTDTHGRPANGGPATPGWQVKSGLVQRINGPLTLCGPGALHGTYEPHRWRGTRVWVAGFVGEVAKHEDKLGSLHREIIGEVYPECALSDSVGVRLGRKDLARATLSGAILSGAALSGADLSWADLSWADLSRADLSGANLSWANLYRANLSWANLSWANLYGATLYVANLSGADLSWANLSMATLSRANLSGATLSGAALSRADLSVANLSGAKRPENDLPGYKANKDGFLEKTRPLGEAYCKL